MKNRTKGKSRDRIGAAVGLSGKTYEKAKAVVDAAEVVNNLSPIGNILPANEARREMALNLNLHRRHLSVEDRQKLALEMRRNGQSYRAIGEKLGADKETIRNNLETVYGGENSPPYTNLDVDTAPAWGA